jgi:hypothetical protein
METPDPVARDLRDEFIHAGQLVHAQFADTATEPWTDDQGVVHLGVTAQADQPAIRQALDDSDDLDVVLDLVEHPQTYLDDIVVNVYKQPGLEAITSATHDYAHNQVVLTASEVTPDVQEALAAAYGGAVVLESVPEEPIHASRDADTNPFYAGGMIEEYQPSSGTTAGGACTNGFSWITGLGDPRIITAGHCYPDVWTDGGANDIDGARTDYGCGACYHEGKAIASTYTSNSANPATNVNGDLAIINTDINPDGTWLGRQGAPQMFVGGVNSTDHIAVTGVDKWSAAGDQVCFSGSRTGTHCGSNDNGWGSYHVDDTSASYSNVNHVVKASLGWGHCPFGGDSGGPVYKLSGDTAIARGIISGSNDEIFISHADGSLPFTDCHLYYTDIGQAYQQWTEGHIEVQ